MNLSNTIDPKVLLCTARVKAALDLFPRLIGSKESYVEWMRVNLDVELSALSRPKTHSPHPRILGSLGLMLERHYLSGMTTESLRLDQVREDDPEVSGEEYIDVPLYDLPKLQGTDFWWNVLPPSVQLANIPPSTPSPSAEIGQSSQVPSPAPRKITLKLKPPKEPLNATSAPPALPIPPTHLVNATVKAINSNTASLPRSGKNKGSRKRTHVEVDRTNTKRIRKKEKATIDSDESSEADSSSVAAKADLRVRSERSEDLEQDCEACKSREIECVWPGGSASQKEKRACVSCVSHKSRCYIEGVFSIRRQRGKAATSQLSIPQEKETIQVLKARIAELEGQLLESQRKLSAIEEKN